MAKKTPTAIDLFSGCGGLTLGLKQAGFRVLAGVEIDALAVETYKKNHPKIRVWKTDISKLSPRTVMRKLGLRKGDLDLLAGCPPCQGFSTLRTLNGSRRNRDARNNLLFEFLRFVKAMAPKAVMLENVPGLSDKRSFRSYRSHLRKLGYKEENRVLNAADYGVPQRRRRLISVASRLGEVEFAPPADKRITVRDAIGFLPSPGDNKDPLHETSQKRSDKILELISRIPKNGGSRTDLPRRQWLKCHKKCGGFKDVYGRMAWDDVGPTITGGCINPSKGRFLHPEQDRAITLREAALLQGFPRDYKISLSRGRFYAADMIGNALPPELIRRLASGVKLLVEAHS